MTATYREQGDIAVITLNNPPVNGLGHATRSGIVEGIAKAAENAAIKAVVIVGEGRGFSGGADIREFNTPKAMQEPSLMTVISIVEASDKPVIAAIHGVAMGGGLELALGCHYRVAVAGAQIALPEVNIGILPGAGGTQRLPRILGLEPALNMIVSGKTIMSDKSGADRIDVLIFFKDKRCVANRSRSEMMFTISLPSSTGTCRIPNLDIIKAASCAVWLMVNALTPVVITSFIGVSRLICGMVTRPKIS
jgi:hypothetical protein